MANYGDRARIGMLLPSVNRAAEPQITEMLPRGVALHTTRLRLTSSDDDAINEMVWMMHDVTQLYLPGNWERFHGRR